MNLTAPTAPYTPVKPAPHLAAPYLPWLIDRAVRVGRSNNYSNIVDDAIELIFSEFGVRRPEGGFVDSEGRNAYGTLTGGFDADGFDANGYDRNGRDRDGFDADGRNSAGQTREQFVEDLVSGWSPAMQAAIEKHLSGRGAV